MGIGRLLAIVAGIALGMAVPAGAAPLDTVLERGQLRIAVYRDFPPFSDGAGGALAGVDVDLGRRIAAALGVAPDFFVLTADESLSDDLRNGVWKGPRIGGPAADLMLHVPYDREFALHEEFVVLFGTYYKERLAIARPRAPATLAALSEDRIGVEIDSISDHYLSFAFGGGLRDNLVRFLTYDEMAKALFAGEIDAIMGPLSQVEHAVAERRDRYEVTVPAAPGLLKPSWDLGMAVKHDSRDLGYAVGDIVRRLIEDGTMARIFADHGLTYTPPDGP